jgi:hypothetical protein
MDSRLRTVDVENFGCVCVPAVRTVPSSRPSAFNKNEVYLLVDKDGLSVGLTTMPP